MEKVTLATPDNQLLKVFKKCKGIFSWLIGFCIVEFERYAGYGKTGRPRLTESI